MANSSKNKPRKFFLILILCFPFLLCHAATNITNSRSLRDSANGTLVSSGGKFQLGFFSLNDSRKRYLGIWWSNQIPSYDSVVWVANRDRPISDKSGVLKIADDGNLELADGRNNRYWSSGVPVSAAPKDSIAELQDKGNLVLASRNHVRDHYKVVWRSFESFDYLTDTFLPGMEVLFSASMTEFKVFKSWKSPNDPSPGTFSMGIDPRGAPQVVIWEGLKRRWRSGHWDKQKFIGIPHMSSSVDYGFDIDSEGGGNLSFVYNYYPKKSSDLLMFRLRWNGFEELLKWDERNQRWLVTQKQPTTQCDFYNKCGNFGMCNKAKEPICDCIEGFKPKDQKEWDRRKWGSGCVRKVSLDCQRNGNTSDGFKLFKAVKLPDLADHVAADDKDHCERKCLKNCSCTAYAYEHGINCMLWTQELSDMQQFPADGATLYLRLAASELGGKSSTGGKRKVPESVIVVVVIGGAGLLGVGAWLVWRFKAKPEASTSHPERNNSETPRLESSKSKELSAEVLEPNDLETEGNQVKGAELPFFSLTDVTVATNNFSEENKLGKGGFGHVYKGTLRNGQDIAVKRLAGRSCQGLQEFKNEIRLIAKLQHRNLVSLLGCCVEGEEYMLLYEYMPNKSLDFFLFDETNAVLLDWRKRFAIIEGIVRGLIYLHRDSRLRIIHRDLKASNILLDEDMNPKISDFGIARIFGANEIEANTIRVVGTYGYMSPEYAMEGLFSIKSDVYSFGVLTLEVVSGRKNTSFRSSEHLNLIAYAWSLWKDGRAIELVDMSIRPLCSQDEVLRCIHIGMLCVQDSAASRPTMSQVLTMLESEDATLPQPEQPNYRRPVDMEGYIEGPDTASMNNLTATVIHGR